MAGHLSMNLPQAARGLHIDDVQLAWSLVPRVVLVRPLLDASGATRKGPGNRYSPHELEVPPVIKMVACTYILAKDCFVF